MMSFPFRQAADAGSRRGYRLPPSRAYLLGVLLLASVLVGGCLPVADPVTRSRIRNDTTALVEIELTLDWNQWHHGFTPETYRLWLSERSADWFDAQFQDYLARSEGVELIAWDRFRLAGSYRLAPAALLTLYDGMGTGPNHHLSKLVLTQGDATRTVSSAAEIRGLLRRVEGNLWELRITDLW